MGIDNYLYGRQEDEESYRANPKIPPLYRRFTKASATTLKLNGTLR